MPAGKPGNMTQVFDDMLAHDRSEFDRLFKVPGAFDQHSSFARRPLAPSAQPAVQNEATGMLSRRFGDDWRFDIAEQRREGDALIVIGKVSIPSRNISVTQSASVSVQTAGDRSGRISGTADGIAFSAGSDDGVQVQAGEAGEEAALRRATDEVMRSCLRWL